MSRRGPAVARALTLAVLAVLGTSGCVGAGLAGGPLVSAVQLIGDRTVERTVGADLAEALGVTEAVLVRMGFQIEGQERGEGVRRLRAVAEEITVHVTLERVTGKLTRLGLRVETGRLLADRNTGTQIHEQVAAALAPAPLPAPTPGAAEALTTLQGEIRKLRSDIGERRAERPAPGGETGTALRVEPGAIVTVPMSAALPTIGGPAPAVSVQAPVAPIVVTPAAVASSESRARATEAPDSRVAAPLRPATALTPIPPTSGVARDR